MTTYGGFYDSFAAVKNVLAAQGFHAPHTNQPYNEAMLLGISGGLGAGYILWEFKAHQSATVVIGFTNRWNYSAERTILLCERLGFTPTVQETGGVKAAAANLQAALDAGTPVVVWTDAASLPHRMLPETLKGYGIHVVGVHGTQGDMLLVDDRAEKLFTVSKEVFAAARNVIPSDKNRLLLTGKPADFDIAQAVQTGLEDHLQHLERDSDSFSLPTYKKWAKMMTDTKNTKGWPTVFKSRSGLYTTLRSLHEHISLDGTEGQGMRSMYADFLDEAAVLLNKPALKDAATAYRTAGKAWITLADAALPNDVPVLAETKSLMQQRYDHYRHNRLDDLRATMDKINALEAAHKADFPMDEAGVDALFADIGEKIKGVYEVETAALKALKEAL